MIALYILLQHMNVSGTALRIDIQTIGIAVDHIRIRPQSIKHIFCNGGCTAISTVQGHLFVLKGAGGNGYQISNIAVSSCRIVYGPPYFIPKRKGNLPGLTIQIFLNLQDHILFQLFPFSINDFDSIIIVRVMAGRNHNPAVKALCPYDIGNAWCTGHMQQVDIRSAGC